MNLFSMLLTDSATPTSSGTPAVSNNSWLIFVILGGLLVFMLVFSFISNKKREKQGAEMQSLIKVGAKVKTIGGFVGTIERIDDEKGLLTLNIGTEDSPTYVVIDRSCIYQIENPESANAQNEEKSDDVYGYDSKDSSYESKEESASDEESYVEEKSDDEESQDND